MNGLSFRTRRLSRRLSRQQNEQELNLVSMIDILTVLVFFLLVNTTGVSVLNLNLPDTGATAPAKATKGITLDVRPTGLTLSSDADQPRDYPVSADGLRQLNAEAQVLKDRFPQENRITLRLDPGVPYETLVQAMDAVRTTPPEVSPTRELFPNIGLGDLPAEGAGASAGAPAVPTPAPARAAGGRP